MTNKLNGRVGNKVAHAGTIEIKVMPDLSTFTGDALDELARKVAARLAEWRMFDEADEFAAWFRRNDS